VALRVNVTLDGRTVHNSAIINIYKGPGPAPFQSFATGYWQSWSGTCNPDTVNDTFQFYGSATGGKAPYAFSWNFSDGSPLTSIQDPIHTFQSSSGPNSINVNLTVTDHLGSQTIAYLRALEPNPSCPPPGTTPPVISSFTVSPNPDASGYPAFFNVSASGGTPPFSYHYNGLPPGCSTANTSLLQCTPSSIGNFTIRVFVNDSASRSTNATVLLNVNVGSVLLASVMVNPVSSNLTINGEQTFTATTRCTAVCPPGITYSWSLTNDIGTLTSTSGPSTTFVAGNNAGTTALVVKASLGSKVVSSSVEITISPKQSSLSVPPWATYVIIAMVIGLVVALLVVSRRKRQPLQEETPDTERMTSSRLNLSPMEPPSQTSQGSPQMNGEDLDSDPLADMA
jgi:hypothetical protein